ncbi:pilus assembly protein TadG-related protein [Rodentibacter caecimuris]|uniref:pilus assembly protein TadG-related protein n=1 Tax=Rodentibacter caecimuris TaxID=1796644 RepID=UPI0022499ACA|nr:TadE/TadG family type IV pilus assembly protein [Rodentibacter heylii]MCX2961827.1 pilus assembly protein [Rodentibacter heylii]
MRKKDLIVYCYQALKRFYSDESGVYAVMTALLAFPLLFLISFAVDGSGILLDKARLAQATDQGALVLVAENNGERENKAHSDVKRQNPSKEEIAKAGEGGKFAAQQHKRNLELVHGIAEYYLRSDKSGAGNVKSKPVIITKDFDYACEKKEKQENPYVRKEFVTCSVQGSVDRQFWLPWGQSALDQSLLKVGRTEIGSGKTYAVKEKGAIPVELMLVLDFSGSMLDRVGEDTQGRKEKDNDPQSKINILRRVVGNIQDILLPPKAPEKVSPFNRIGFTAFAAGAKQRGESSCVLPYYGNSRLESRIKKQLLEYDWDMKDFNRYLDVRRTIDQIYSFNGSKINYSLTFNNGRYCLGGNEGKQTTQAWFSQDKRNIMEILKRLYPKGGAAASSGMIIGANIMMDKNTNPNAEPSKLGSNTQRVMLVLSDGMDNRPTDQTLIRLLDGGMCEAIRNQVDSLQDPSQRKQPTRIGFVAFGFNPPANQVRAWKKCVGEHYYQANNEKELLESFKQIIGIEEEVGRSSSKKPSF